MPGSDVMQEPGAGGQQLPDDVAALLGPDASAGLSPGSSAADGSGSDKAAAPMLEPGQRTSEGISLLAPSADDRLPQLSQEQRDAIPRLRQSARQGQATISYLR